MLALKEKKKELIDLGRILYQRSLLVGSSGNLSLRLDKNKILISAHDSYLGFLNEGDLLLIDNKGNLIESSGKPTLELNLHLAIHNQLNTNLVIHAHPPFTNAFFSKFSNLENFSYETRFYLGDVAVLAQDTPTVTKVEEVVEELKKNNIVVLKNHGIVAIGEDWKSALALIEMLEELCKVNIALRGLKEDEKTATEVRSKPEKTYELFSDEHINKIVEMVNNDFTIQQKAQELDLTTRLAIKLDETGRVFNFNFQKGKITEVINKEDGAEFVISGPKQYWRMIFKCQLDPFAATMQKKLILKGDFARLSKWYAPFVKIFEVWRNVAVE